MSEVAIDLSRLRQKAEAWVNGYMATAIGLVIVVSPVPAAATVALCALEATMCFQIGRIYKGDAWNMADARATAGVIGLASFAGKIVAMEAAILLGPFAPVGKSAIAAGIVKAMGQLVIRHFEGLAESQS